MKSNLSFPCIESYLPDIMKFVSDLTQGYQSGGIDSQRVFEEKVRLFFTPDRLAEAEAIAPGWADMAKDIGGLTLCHVTAALMCLSLCPEYKGLTKPQQELMQWVVFFHDSGKRIVNNRRDAAHGFSSAALTAPSLPGIGFAVTPAYGKLIGNWVKLVESAVTEDKTSKLATTKRKTNGFIQDNRKLPEIISGIEAMFGHNSPAALIVKTVLLHMSITVVQDWPSAAPLTQEEINKYVDIDLLPLLKVMMLVDSDAWAIYDKPTKERYRRETLEVFKKIESMV